MENCDALIVGGGPAGSSAARALRAAGLDVVVLDKAHFPRDKVCAGWITPAVLHELELAPEVYGRQGRTLQPIRGFRVACLGKRGFSPPVEVRYDQIVSYGIVRREFDDFLLRRSGARLRLGEPLASLERRGNDWIVNQEIRTPLVIGAGGHFCPVARQLACKREQSESIVVAQEVELALSPDQADSCVVSGGLPELFFCDDLRGYGWCFRKGNFLNAGLGRQDRHGLRAKVEDFVDHLEQARRIPTDLKRAFKGHAYLIYGEGERPLVSDGALLVGDAAGLAYRASGEGIRPAIESGLLAAQTVLEADGYDRAQLATYRERLNQRFESSGPGRSLLPERWRGPLARRLFASPRFVRRVLVDRWFLHRNQEPLSLPRTTPTIAAVA